jgi:hypothetical protein
MARLNASQALSAADKLLGTILNSRLQRKAKSIILSAIEFLVVDFAMVQTYVEYEIENPQVELGLKVTLYGGAIYVVFVALFLFLHSTLFLRVTNMKTSERIENAYAKTNRLPFVDGILEIPFPMIFKGSYWYLPYISWLVCGLVTGINSYLFYVVRDQLTATAFATLVAGALLLYQITSDFSEYWVHTRHRESITTEDGENATLTSTNSASKVNSGDVEESISVGKRETSSAGFVRI